MLLGLSMQPPSATNALHIFDGHWPDLTDVFHQISTALSYSRNGFFVSLFSCIVAASPELNSTKKWIQLWLYSTDRYESEFWLAPALIYSGATTQVNWKAFVPDSKRDPCLKCQRCKKKTHVVNIPHLRETTEFRLHCDVGGSGEKAFCYILTRAARDGKCMQRWYYREETGETEEEGDAQEQEAEGEQDTEEG